MFYSHKFFNTINKNRRISSVIKFTIKDQNKSAGHLFRVDIKHKEFNGAHIVNQIVQSHPNCIFIVTTPTVRLSNECNTPYPGHNFVFISGPTGNVLSCISKRPDMKNILWERKRAHDTRFIRTYLPIVRVYSTRFTSYEEEIQVWEKKAASVAEYPLFIHVMPLRAEIGMDASCFQTQAQSIIAHNSPYALHSTFHPNADHLLPAANCNGAVYEAIYGTHNALVQDMFCQEAVIKIMQPFIDDWASYENLAAELGLMKGIEPSPIIEERYRPAFTC